VGGAERLGNLHQVEHSYVADTPRDARHVGPVDASLVGEGPLGQALLPAELLDSASEPPEEWIGCRRHRVMAPAGGLPVRVRQPTAGARNKGRGLGRQPPQPSQQCVPAGLDGLTTGPSTTIYTRWSERTTSREGGRQTGMGDEQTTRAAAFRVDARNRDLERKSRVEGTLPIALNAGVPDSSERSPGEAEGPTR